MTSTMTEREALDLLFDRVAAGHSVECSVVRMAYSDYKGFVKLTRFLVARGYYLDLNVGWWRRKEAV